MRSLAYTRFELLRTSRSRRMLFLSIVGPVVIFYAIAAPHRSDTDFDGLGLSLPLYYMVSLISFGTMAAMISSGTRIAGERSVGWTRQLRITPLSTRDYFRAKLIVAYAVAGSSMMVLYASGALLGVRLPADRWLEMTGVALGHALNVDAVGPANGILVSLLGAFSGTWFPITSGFLHSFGQYLPSWWLVQASHVGVGGQGWGTKGWLVVAIWAVVCAGLARAAYRRDTQRL